MDTLCAVLEAETGLPAEQQRLLHNGRDVAPGCAAAPGQGSVGGGWLVAALVRCRRWC